jgi:hypothetical protein
MISNDKFKAVVKYLLPIAFLIWGIYASLLILKTGNLRLLVLYNFYTVYLIAISVYCRTNLLQPIGLSALIGFLAFGNNIPLFTRGLIANSAPWDADLMANTMTVFLVSQFAFALGALFYAGKLSPSRFLLNSKYVPVKVGAGRLVLLIVFVVLAGLFRIQFNIGAAKAVSPIPFSGYFHYALLDGLLMVCLWHLSRTLKGSVALTLLALVPLLGIVFTQAMLGWRGMIFRVAVCVVTVFWFQKRLYRSDRVRSFGWLALMMVVGFSSIELGQNNRAEIMKSRREFALTPLEFAEKIQLRSQGTTRLATVIEHFGPLTYTNDWRFSGMLEQGVTATDYIDSVVYGISSDRKHSIGCSGPGGLYVYGGMVAVAVVFLFWGAFFNDVFKQIEFGKDRESNILAIAYYAILVNALLGTNSENFDAQVVKKLLLVTAMVFVCKIFLFSSRKLQRSTNGQLRSPSFGYVSRGNS